MPRILLCEGKHLLSAASTPSDTWFGWKEQHPRLWDLVFPCDREQLCLDVTILLVGQTMIGGPEWILQVGNLL